VLTSNTRSRYRITAPPGDDQRCSLLLPYLVLLFSQLTMPPSASSSKKKKEKGGKKKQQHNKPQAIDDEEIKKLSEEFMASSLGPQFRRREERINCPGWVEPPTCPDNPPCDGCRKRFAGTMQCAGCESVFYCGRECQVAHWTATHKAECALLKQRNHETAKRVLGLFAYGIDWNDLDLAGAYKAAVHLGLHDKIREAMELDRIGIMAERCEDVGVFLCYTRIVMNTLFVGQRAEGKKDQETNSFNCMDGLRIKGYVKSHPAALDTWLRASVEFGPRRRRPKIAERP
jgi:MYND finger